METKKTSELRRGVLVFLALAVLTAVEYIIGTNEAPTIFLWVIAILKGALVLVYFMHITRLSGSEGGHE
ncbi:MAG TPA: cytochrome C oxidase subunit IV family protein [Bellilinea sp.]